MPTLEPLDFSQPKNDLSDIAKLERTKLIPKNDYETTNKYSSVNPNALADGDNRGKGTGGDLDVHNKNAGAIQDIAERTSLIVGNEFKPSTPYTTPTA